MEVINLRSDTQTLPTAQMLQAIVEAPLGDDTYDEDPTVARLEAMAAERFGKEAALLVTSGHMGNLVALMVHAGPGDEVLLDAQSHIFCYETGSMASLAAVMPRPLPSSAGRLDPDAVAAAVRPADVHYPRPKLLCLENTHNRSGGRVVPIDLHRRLCAVAHDAGLRVHLDGARIFNAAIATGEDVTAFAETVDSVMFCLSKGLSCPLGSMLVGSKAFIDEADHVRRRLGGGMRQAGVIAAPGIVALTTMVDRLAEDHAHARRLAAGLAAAGLAVDVAAVETNMVLVETGALSTHAALERLGGSGIVAAPRAPNRIRLVTHRHHDAATIDEAVRRIAAALR
jgi:threonine aldolase